METREMKERRLRLRAMFNTSLDHVMRVEKKRADDWKEATSNIHVSHLFCKCGIPVRKSLLDELSISSPLMVRDFLFYFYKTKPKESQSRLEYISQTAKTKGVHPAVILFEEVKKSHPPVTVKDVIQGLKDARLYRVIAQLQAPAMKDLSHHAAHHDRQSCCELSIQIPMGLCTQRESRPSPWTEPNLSSRKAPRGIILLTFVEDGRNHAMKVKEVLENSFDAQGRSYIVYMLSYFSEQLIEDPLHNVLWLLTLVDFVVPILTDGYMKMIDDRRSHSFDIDEKYAPLVAKVLLDKWAANSFRNRQLRCFKPKDSTWLDNDKPTYPPLYTFVTEPVSLPSILIKSKSRLQD